ncbi:MAG: DUF2905 family protein [Chloroflexota bacterium]|nr:DUF2905 family protein [Chloroflexota bacterium]
MNTGGLETIGKVLIGIGAVLVLLGGLLWLLSRVSFLGRLPGDIRIERPGFKCLIPLTSSIIISLLLTILLNVVIQIVRRLIH